MSRPASLRVLVTGSSGQVGGVVTELIEQRGWVARRFDLDRGDDLRDAGVVRDAVAGCDAIVHAGALAHDSAGTPEEIVATNVLGTWHVLAAAERYGARRVVYFSSGQVFGFAEGAGVPAYLPVDDDHPLRANRPYGMSKRLAEDMCEAWTARTGIPTIVLRPVMILDDSALTSVTESDAELGAFVHLRDVAEAAVLALTVDASGHERMTLCGPGPFDCAVAQRVLGWTPRHTWPTRGRTSLPR